jgi:hypothetical protein
MNFRTSNLPQFLILDTSLVPRDYKSKHRVWGRTSDFSHQSACLVANCYSPAAFSQQHFARRRSAEFCSMSSMQLHTIKCPIQWLPKFNQPDRLRDDQVLIP